MKLSVVICTYNPDLKILSMVLKSLQEQSIPMSDWRLIIVDNKSKYTLKEHVDLSWHPNHLIIREEKIGLLNARITGYNLSEESLIVFVDDDNQLKKDYLEVALKFHRNYPQVGSFGGKSLPIYETAPPQWFHKAGISLGCQDHGESLIMSEYHLVDFTITEYPFFAPIGTGMAVTKPAMRTYINDIKDNKERLKLGRSGDSLYSGEDNDMNLTFIKKGFEIAYVPELVVNHIIPEKRIRVDYLSHMSYNSSRSWIKLLYSHQLHSLKPIPKWTVPLRKVKAWIVYEAWKSSLNYIRWRGACGTFEALSQLHE